MDEKFKAIEEIISRMDAEQELIHNQISIITKELINLIQEFDTIKSQLQQEFEI